MFRANILPIFRSTRWVLSTHDVAGQWPATSLVHNTTSCNTQSGAPEDVRDQLPKHVLLIGIINKPLLLLLVGVYIIYVNEARSNKYIHKFRTASNGTMLVTHFVKTCPPIPKMKQPIGPMDNKDHLYGRY